MAFLFPCCVVAFLDLGIFSQQIEKVASEIGPSFEILILEKVEIALETLDLVVYLLVPLHAQPLLRNVPVDQVADLEGLQSTDEHWQENGLVALWDYQQVENQNHKYLSLQTQVYVGLLEVLLQI